MNQNALTRREALKTAALGAFFLPLLGSISFAAESKKAEKAPAAPAALPSYATFPDGRENGLRLGVTSYSTRTLTLDESIATMKVVRISNLALFKAHCNWEGATVDECRAVGAKLKAAGLRLTGSGVINLPNDEAKCRQAFENVKAGGMATMVCKPAKDAFRLVEKLAKEFDQKLAIHNHGPEDNEYPTPAVAFEAIKSLDSRIGLCIDVGHTARFGEDPIVSIKKYAARVYDVHLKDSVAIVGAKKDVPIEVGAGRLDIRGMLRALLEVKYNGVVTFEYEKVAGNPVTGLAESLGYVRGMLAAMAKA
ncbi:MAG: sugar phosphate isomerase/epimerase [Opitutus sp.]|nr:sugar phosphate isomerase/epimerase [Opitutus sp.]